MNNDYFVICDESTISLTVDTSVLNGQFRYQSENSVQMTLSYWKLCGQKAGQSGLYGCKTLLSTFQTLMAANSKGKKRLN